MITKFRVLTIIFIVSIVSVIAIKKDDFYSSYLLSEFLEKKDKAFNLGKEATNIASKLKLNNVENKSLNRLKEIHNEGVLIGTLAYIKFGKKDYCSTLNQMFDIIDDDSMLIYQVSSSPASQDILGSSFMGKECSKYHESWKSKLLAANESEQNIFRIINNK